MFKINIKKLVLSVSLVVAMTGSLLPVLVPASVAAQPTSTTAIQIRENDCRGRYDTLNSSNCAIIAYIVVITNIISGIAGVVIVCAIIYAGIKYSMAKSDPQAVAEARKIIANSVVAIFVYIFLFAFVQWAVPGGII